MVEFANRLTDRGHSVTFYVPAGQPPTCRWMPLRAGVRTDARGFRRRAGRHLLRPREPVARDRPLLVARRRVFYATHGKPGSRKAWFAPVDLQLANSGWTADRVAEATGHRPVVVLGGVNRDTFHPQDRPKRHRILCTGDQVRAWKGTATVEEAGRLLGVAGGGSLGEGPEAGRPGAGVRGRRGVRRGQLVRGVRPAGARGDGMRRPARHHRQRWQPGVRARRRDRAGRPAEGCLGDGRRAASRARTTRPWPPTVGERARARRPASSTGTTAPTTSPRCSTAWWPTRHRPPSGSVREPHPNPELSIVTLQWNGMAHTQADGRVGPSQHRRALRADHRGQRLGMGGGQLRVQRG